MPRHAKEQLVKGQVAARVDDGARAVVHNQELVGLHRLAVLFHQVGEHQADMLRITVKLNGRRHQNPKFETRRDSTAPCPKSL